MKKYSFPNLLVIGLLLFSLVNSSIAQTSTRITGVIISSADGKPVESATIQILPGTRSVLSDKEGKFSLEKQDATTIRISFVGFSSEEISIGNKTSFSIDLKPQTVAMEDVVVVGYSTQKKVNLTGAVQTLRFSEAVNQPVTNSAQLMYGQFSGVQLTQGGGLPGSDGSSIIIRGIGTFGNSSPLVVIDNIQYNGLAEFNSLAPTDIESISVLKDASASAIYGARGANGVILVTTKKGKKGKSVIDYNNYIGFQRPTVVPRYLNAMDYARLRRERDVNLNGANTPIRYTEADIAAMANGTNPDQFANTNWANEILRDAPVQQHYLSFTSGSDATTVRVSLGYLEQDAIVRGKFKNNRYNLGLNITNQTTSWLSMSLVSNTFWERFTGPLGGPDAITGEDGIINQFQRSLPTVPVRYSNGEFGFVDGAWLRTNASLRANNPIWRGQFGDYENNNFNTSNRFAMTAKFLQDFTFEVSGAFNLNQNFTSNWSPSRIDRDWEGRVVIQNDLNQLTNNYTNFIRLQYENVLRYSKQFKRHNIFALGGFTAIYDKFNDFNGSLQGFPSNSIRQFNGGGVVNPNVSGGANETALQSYFGRVNYSFDDRYLFEFNVRRDGSSRFGPTNRFGTFPSLSAGWNLSKESFFKSIKSINLLKLRASWGLTGNDRIGNYIWEQNYNIIDYLIGGAVVPAVALTSLANPTIAWEKNEQLNIGLDLAMLQNKLNVNLEYFSRKSTDVLYANFPIPRTLGVTSLAAQNAASMLNEGLELNASYKHNFGALKMTIGGNVTWMADNQVTGLGESGAETIGAFNIIRRGAPYNAFFGYRVQGIFQTAAEVAAAPRQFGSTLTRAGDIRYTDISGPDGRPDGIIDARDRVVIGNPYPRWMYGFNLNLQYKDFDMGAIFQGLGRVDRIFQQNGQLPMTDDRNNALTYWMNRWTPENPSTKLPRLGGVNNQQFSDFYIQDASYLRLRNLEIGYTLPASLTGKAKIQRFRVFVSAQNLLTFTKLENFDPERATGSASDRNVPLYKVFTTGVNLKF